jgi:hypothetical protein
VLSYVTMSLVTERPGRNVSAIFAAVVNEQRLPGLTHNPRPVTPALWTRRRFRLNAGRLLRSFAKWTEHVSAISTAVDGWWSVETPRSVTAAFRADGRRLEGRWTFHEQGVRNLCSSRATHKQPENTLHRGV